VVGRQVGAYNLFRPCGAYGYGDHTFLLPTSILISGFDILLYFPAVVTIAIIVHTMSVFTQIENCFRFQGTRSYVLRWLFHTR